MASRGAAMARAALGVVDANANARARARDDGAGDRAAKRAAGRDDGGAGRLNSNSSATKRRRSDAGRRADDARDAREEDERSARASGANEDARATTGEAVAANERQRLPKKFETLRATSEAALVVARFMRARGQRATADAMCANIERSTGRRCSLETLRMVAACAPAGTITFRAKTSRADDLKNIHVDVDLGIEEGSSGNDKAGMVAMRAKMAAIRAKMVMIVANTHEGDAYDASAAPPESWREDFDLESVPLPAPVKIAFMEDSSRDGPRLLSSTSAPLLGEASTSALGRGGVSEGELTRAMSDLGPDGKGISARAVQAVLERQAIVEAFNDPSAVADRERRRLHGRLPHVFDAVRTAFAARKRSVMELDPLLDELMHTNARAEISAHELADGVRILARMCPEWCTIVHARHGDEELFRIVSRDPATARVARAKLAKLCRDAA
mgnify:FL=1|tara:strand:- start:7075 stop:8406 length:1332 start_codon:yes stop_codon:yes gene_type:complete